MKEIINFEYFSKLDIRVGKVLKAERIEGSGKLILLSINLGEEKERQLVAGIGKSYSPEELEGKNVTVLANLKPREIMGYESQGMILAAGDEAGPVIISALKEVKAGSTVS